MSDHMTTITADKLLERADVCAFRDTALELLRADASPWQLRTALERGRERPRHGAPDAKERGRH